MLRKIGWAAGFRIGSREMRCLIFAFSLWMGRGASLTYATCRSHVGYLFGPGSAGREYRGNCWGNCDVPDILPA